MQQTEQQDKQRRLGGSTGKGFMPGKSGNPAGRSERRIYAETFSALASELGGEASLSASQRMLIDTIAKLKSRTGKRDDVRIANAIAKLVRLLGINVKPAGKPAH